MKIKNDIKTNIKILIADDYFLIREGLKNTLKTFRNIKIVGEIDLSHQIPAKVKEFVPDILLMEINFCEKSIKELVKEVNELSPLTKIMVISDCNCKLSVINSIKAGISGFVRKNVTREELNGAIRAIISGKQYFAEDITSILIKSISNSQRSEHTLSERELGILKLICQGHSNQQIGETLFLSEKTIATHKRNIMRKAGVKKTSDLILWALNNNIITKS